MHAIVTAETSKRKMEQKLFDIILLLKREKHDANEKNMWTSGKNAIIECARDGLRSFVLVIFS